MKGMRDKDELTADIATTARSQVENHFVGRLKGFRFSPETQARTAIHGKATRHAAAQVLSRELAHARAPRRGGQERCLQADAQRPASCGATRRSPGSRSRRRSAEADRHAARRRTHVRARQEKVQARLETWVRDMIAEKLKPLVDLAKAEDVTGLARGIAFRLTENFGDSEARDGRRRDQVARSGVARAAAQVRRALRRLQHLLPAAAEAGSGRVVRDAVGAEECGGNNLSLDALPEPPRAGLTSVTADPATPEAFYRAYGFHVCGPRAVRLDILERLADLIRPLLAWRASPTGPRISRPKARPATAASRVTPEMMSILGCSPDELGDVLKSLGFRLERRRKVKQVAAPVAEVSESVPVESAGQGAGQGEVLGAEAAEAAGGSTPAATADAEATPVESADAPSGEASEGAASGASAELGEAAGETAPSEAPAGEVASGEMAPMAAVAAPGMAEDAAAPVNGAESDGAAAEASEAEEFEEIWRPKRHHRHGDNQRGRPRGRGRARGGDRQAGSGSTAGAASGPQSGAPGDGGVPAAGADAGSETSPRSDDGKRSRGGRGRGGGRNNGPAAVANSQDARGQGAGGAQGTGGGGRHGGRGSDGPGGKGRQARGGGYQGGRNRDNDRRKDGGRKPEVHSSGPRRKGGVDPDSPFAALEALKQSLVNKGGDDKS